MSIVNALPKVVGFLRVLRFPLTGKVDRVGKDKNKKNGKLQKLNNWINFDPRFAL